MKEEKLKEIFNLMYKKLTELAVDDKFKSWIESLRINDFEKNKVESDNFFFEKLVSTIFVSGFKSIIFDKKWPSIKKAFNNFNVAKISQYDEEKINKIINTPNIIKNKAKIKAIINNAKKYVEIKQKYGSFTNYIESFKNPLELAKNLTKNFHYIGPTNVWDYLKLIGIDAIKPDVHVRRILYRLGLINNHKPNPETIKQVFKTAQKISKATGEKLSVIDAVIWFYGAERPEIKKTYLREKTALQRVLPHKALQILPKNQIKRSSKQIVYYKLEKIKNKPAKKIGITVSEIDEKWHIPEKKDP